MKFIGRASTYTVLLLLFLSVSIAGEPAALGNPLSDQSTVTIGELLAHPDRYVDKRVKVEGKITDVCPKAGCWVDIADGEQKIRFKVKDYEIVFESETKGENVVAEGIFTKIEMSAADAEAYARHHAEETGQTYDPSMAEAARTIYRINGIGAVLGGKGELTGP